MLVGDTDGFTEGGLGCIVALVEGGGVGTLVVGVTVGSAVGR